MPKLSPLVVSIAFGAFGLASCKDKPRETKNEEPTPAASRSATSAGPRASAKPVPAPADAIAETGGSIKWLSADETHLYWVSSGYQGTAKGILSMPKEGGEPKKLAHVQQALGAWVTKGQLYFYDAGPELFAMPKGGGKPVSILKNEDLGLVSADVDTLCFIGARETKDGGGAAAPRGKVLQSDERTLYCKKDEGERVSVAPATLFSGSLFVSGDQVFWTSSLDQSIRVAPVAGGQERTVARDAKVVGAFAANQSSLFFIGSLRDDPGLFAVPKKGGTPKKLVTLAPNAGRGLGADKEHVYYAIADGVFRVPLPPGKPSALLEGEAKDVQGLVVDDSSVYLAAGPYLRRLKKTPP